MRFYPGGKERQLPDLSAVDPAVRRLLEEIQHRRLPWSAVDEAVRRWLYYPPVTRSPSIALVRRNLQLLDLDLHVGRAATVP